MASSAASESGAEEQTIDHVELQCQIRLTPHGLRGLTNVQDGTIEWLLYLCPKIQPLKQWIVTTRLIDEEVDY